MATVEECREALDRMLALLEGVDPEVRRKHAVDRTVTCRITDLEIDFSGEFRDGDLVELRLAPDPSAQLKLKVSSDDLLALSTGELHVAKAWATGRLRVSASMRDLLRIRSMF